MVDLSTFGVAKGKENYHEEIVYSLALVYHSVNTDISGYLKDFNLTVGKLNILIAIKHQGGTQGIRQVDVSKHLIVTPSNMTKMIDKLEAEKLVSRFSMQGDRRVNIVKVTQRGSDLLDSIWEGYNKRLKQAVSCLDKNKQKQLAGLLARWLEKM